jgi:hypothetical protein
MVGARKKTTVYINPELLRAVKALAASSGRHDYEILEDALRLYLRTSPPEVDREALRTLLAQLRGPAELTDDEALSLAYGELHAARRARP